jgi:hypothetical protein
MMLQDQMSEKSSALGECLKCTKVPKMPKVEVRLRRIDYIKKKHGMLLYAFAYF